MLRQLAAPDESNESRVKSRSVDVELAMARDKTAFRVWRSVVFLDRISALNFYFRCMFASSQLPTLRGQPT